MKSFWLTSIFIVSCILNKNSEARKNEEVDLGYTWKTYKGYIPDNALPGGQDVDGSDLYIGRAKYRNSSVIPGFLNEEEQTLYIAVDSGVYPIRKNIEILCTDNPDDFDWIQTAPSDFRLSVHLPLVSGGYDEGGYSGGYALAVGRKIWNSAIFIGNARFNRDTEGIAFGDDERKFHLRKENFEILIHNRVCSLDISERARKRYGVL